MSAETVVREPETEAVEAPAQAPAPAPPEATPAAPPPAAAVVQPACQTCGAPMAAGQEWCLECGTRRAARRRLLATGWRGPAAALTATGVLAAGAVAAAYAGLKADDHAVAQQAQAGAPAAPVTPSTATPPATPAPTGQAPSTATPPGAALPGAKAPTSVPSTKTPPGIHIPTAKPPVSTPTPAPTPAPAATQPATPAPSHHTTTHKRPKPVNAPKYVAVRLPQGAAATYNPDNHPASDFPNDPQQAIDGNRSTAWVAPVNASAGNDVSAGVALNLGKLVGVRAIDLRTSTPGFDVDVWGTTLATPPASFSAKGWKHLASQLDVDGTQRIVLGDGSGAKRYRYVLAFVTNAPPGFTQVALNELKVLR